MNPKTIVSAVLLLFVGGSLAYMALRKPPAPGRDADDADAFGHIVQAVDGVEPEVVVYFFYNDIRCSACLKLEKYAKEALNTYFPDELASGAIQWRALSMDAPENEHYLTDFGLYSKSLVLVDPDDSEHIRWKNLEAIWDLVYDKPAYLEYMKANIQDFLGAAP